MIWHAGVLPLLFLLHEGAMSWLKTRTIKITWSFFMGDFWFQWQK
jgi:hypothetical protein